MGVLTALATAGVSRPKEEVAEGTKGSKNPVGSR
jgi:hypothetical protein